MDTNNNYGNSSNIKENLFDSLSIGKNLIIDYFFTIGLDYKLYKQDFLNDISNLDQNPVILAKFPKHNSRYPLNELNDIIIKNIFPQKNIEYLLDKNENEISRPVMKEYIIESESQPKEEFHIFSINQQTKNDMFEYQKHFACLIIYEDLSSIIKCKLKKNTKIYLGKALVITSIYPYFSLYRKILYIIHDKIKSKNSCAIEFIIINLILSLEKPTKNDTIINLFDEKDIIIEKNVFLPICDLNILKFFTIFSISDFFVLADKFLKGERIYVFSKDISLLQPTMFIFLSLMFPLNLTSRDYYPILLIDDKIINAFLYDSGVKGMIILVNSELNYNQFKKNFNWEDNTSVIIVDLDTSDEVKRIQGIFYSGKCYDIDGINIKGYLPKIENDMTKLCDIYFELIQILASYKEKNFKNSSYFDDISNDYLFHKIKFVRKFFFTYFCKLIDFYVNFVRFEVESSNEKVVAKRFLFKNDEFLQFVQNTFPKNIEFYKSLFDNIAFIFITNKDFFDNDPDLFSLIFMEELFNISLNNKNLIYLDPFEYMDSIISHKEIKRISIDDNTFKFIPPNEYFYKYDNINDIFSGKIVNEQSIMKIEYILIPRFHFQDFFNYEYLLFENQYIYDNKILSRKDTILMNELEILWKFISKSDLILDFNKSNTFIYVFLLSLKLNSFKGNLEKQKSIIFVLFNILRISNFKINFIYSFIYETIISNNLEELFELDYFKLLINMKINPSYFIVFRKKNEKNSFSSQISKKICSQENFLNLNFGLLHECKFTEDIDIKTYILTKISINNTHLYCNCGYDEILVEIKHEDKTSEFNNLFSPLFILLRILEYFHEKNKIDMVLEDWINDNKGYYEILIFYFKNLELDIMILLE